MKKIRDWNDINVEELDFLKGAENVYRTMDYIVKQDIHSTFDEEKMITRLVSEDCYYARTPKRDAEYEFIFRDRGQDLNGKRIRTAMFTRKYFD